MQRRGIIFLQKSKVIEKKDNRKKFFSDNSFQKILIYLAFFRKCSMFKIPLNCVHETQRHTNI